jgi:hypothetical protein
VEMEIIPTMKETFQEAPENNRIKSRRQGKEIVILKMNVAFLLGFCCGFFFCFFFSLFIVSIGTTGPNKRVGVSKQKQKDRMIV